MEDKKRKSEASVKLISFIEKKTVLEKKIEALENKVNELSHKADSSKDFELLNKSNELLKIVCEKQSLLQEIESKLVK